MKIPFNKPYLTGKEMHYIYQAVQSGKISGNGIFTQKCQQFFEEKYNFRKCLLTTSCTDALEMAAILLDIKAGDEVIAPAYTFVSSANAFILRGATMIFADSGNNSPNINATSIEALITPKTKAIVVVHYAGMACNMEAIMAIAHKHNLFVVEDAAQAIDSFYKGRPLGGIGHLGAFSFHETKNIIAGEGGMLTINDERFMKRAEIIWEKGTNRSAFWRGEVDKYNWVDIGSSFLPSEIVAAFLFAQLENLSEIQQKRISCWNTYHTALQPLVANGYFEVAQLPQYATQNGHIFYLICRSGAERDALITHLKAAGIYAVFHYLSLNNSPFYQNHNQVKTPNSNRLTECLLRLPLFFELSSTEQYYIISNIFSFFS